MPPEERANQEFAGRIYPSGEKMRISAEKIKEFSSATHQELELHYDPLAAKALGYDNIVAPPTFLVTLAQQEEAKYIDDPAARIDFSKVVHAEEKFELKRAILAGDELIPTLEVVSVKYLGEHTMVTTRVTFADQHEEIAKVTSSLVIRG